MLVLDGVTPIGFLVTDPLAKVFHEASALRYIDQCEHAPAVDVRAANDITSPISPL
jgi:hypothetical protein